MLLLLGGGIGGGFNCLGWGGQARAGANYTAAMDVMDAGPVCRLLRSNINYRQSNLITDIRVGWRQSLDAGSLLSWACRALKGRGADFS